MVQVLVSIFHGTEADYNRHAVFLEGQIATNAADLWTIEEMPDPRILKTHAPADIFAGLQRDSETELQANGKAIVVIRNPKAVLVSLRHHHQGNSGIAWNGSWDEWVDEWLKGNRSKEYGGSYFAHVRNWWRLHRRHPNRIHIVYYENMKKSFQEVVSGVARFVGRDLSCDQLHRIEERCSFDNMKSKYKVDTSTPGTINMNHFWRGEVDSWRQILTQEQARKVDDWTRRELGTEMEDGLKIYDLEPSM
jgi:hypothetical protein